MIELILCLSVIINAALMWYGYLLLKKVMYVSENTSEIITAVENYRKHLTGVFELEMFYGDETLKALLEHGNELSKRLEGLDLLINLESTEEQNADDGLFNPAQSTQVEGPE